jgi:GT2 family glycosyltransferase
MDILTTLAENSTAIVSCVVVNWNGVADTVACVASLMAQNYPLLRVIVVDNGSTDDSVARIRAAFPAVLVLEAGKNLGFAGGCNVGIERAVKDGTDFVWLLNNDTVAPPDTCEKLVAKARQEPRAGLIGSVLYYMHDPSRVQAWGGGNLTVWLGQSSHFVAPAKLGATGFLTFASVLIPHEVLSRVGVLYEGFFMYWDDGDFALRVTAAGYGLAVAEDTAVLHKEGGSTEHKSPLMDRFYTAAGMRFLKRHAAVPWFSMTIFLVLRLGKRVVWGEWKNVRAVLRGARDYLRQRGNVYRERI